MNVGELCVREVVITDKESSISEVAALMRKYHVGDVIVIENLSGEKIPVGILTDRDIVIEIIAKNVDMNSINAGDAMSFELLTAREEDDIFDLIKKMQIRGVRRVPVVNDRGGLEGILSVDDLIEIFSEQMINFVKLFFRGRDKEQEYRAP